MRQALIKLKPLALRLLGEKRYLALRPAVFRVLNLVLRQPDLARIPRPGEDRPPAPEHYEAVLAQSLRFSIILPVYDTPKRFLEQCLQSVFDQIYPHWELILVDDCSQAAHVRPMLEEAAARDDRVTLIDRAQNGNISAACNDGLAAATGDYVTVLDHDDMLHEAALYWMADALRQQPDAEYLYSDENKTNARGKRFYGAFLKPGWSPELALQCMYSCHMSVYHRQKAQSIGGFRSAFDGAQDYDFMLRFVARFTRIHHVAKVLYHWREWAGSTALDLGAKPQAYLRQRAAIVDRLEAEGEVYQITDHAQLRGHHHVTFLPRRLERISIVIPTANASAEVSGQLENHARAVVASIVERSTYEDFEILLAHDGNLTEAQQEAFAQIPQLRLVAYDNSEGFNYSDKVNLGAAAATGDHLLLMNDDTRVITPNWMERLMAMAQRPGVGAVGAKLLFPNGRVQHSGIWLRGHVAGHVDYGSARDKLGHDMSGVSSRNCIGVTAACQLTPRAVFEDLGGYATSFPLNYNDVDYCLRLHERGLRSVCLNDVELYHLEGASRTGGQEVAPEEIERFIALWKDRVPVDPYLPSHLV